MGEHTAPVILTESTPYTLILKRYLAREIPSAVKKFYLAE